MTIRVSDFVNGRVIASYNDPDNKNILLIVDQYGYKTLKGAVDIIEITDYSKLNYKEAT